MFDHAKVHHIGRNARFIDHSRREYINHHGATHNFGPVHKIKKAGNVNLGPNYGHLEMNQFEESGEFSRDSSSRDSSPERQDQRHFREDVPRRAQGYPSHGYYDPPPPPRAAPVGPPPGHRDGKQRAHRNPPPLRGRRNDRFDAFLASVDEDQPTRPASRVVPTAPSHQQPVYDRVPASYEGYRNEPEEHPRAHARDTQREYYARVDDRDRAPRQGASHPPQPHNRAPSTPRQAMTRMHPDCDHRGQGQFHPRFRETHRRSPSPAYFDSSDSETHSHTNGNRPGRTKRQGEIHQFDTAMHDLNTMVNLIEL